MGIAIFLVTIIAMVASLLFFPTIKIHFKFSSYWIIVLLGATLMLITGTVSFRDLITSLTAETGMNPLKLVTLFISMTIISIFLDEVGFFKWLAIYLLSKIKGNQTSLFFLVYILVSILTIFTSNDVIILTFTPLIAYFTKAAKIKPLPYLIGILTAANTWSITLIIGNPTNIYLAVNQGINFLNYLQVMWFPGLVAGLTGLFAVYLIFRKDLKEPMIPFLEEVEIENPFLTILGIIFVISTIILLAISNFINFEMWLITLIMALALSINSLIYILIKKQKIKPLIETYKRAPWNFIPLILGMFVLLEGVKQGNYINNLTTMLGKGNTIFSYGFASYLFSNLMNNQPMSMLFSMILKNTSIITIKATYASIIGSNIGVLLTPLGALAGLMWMDLLQKHDIKLSFFGYIKKCTLIGIITLIASLGALIIVF